MGLYGDKKDYEEMVKENIMKANLLHSLSPEEQKQVIELLKQKEEVMAKNGIFANIKLKSINKKIEKIILLSLISSYYVLKFHLLLLINPLL